ncbi:MAG: hypothetical protein M3162_09960 [Thermoproteota archaeon]|nr:hypothetical protein [Thermoproteota archaeon]
MLVSPSTVRSFRIDKSFSDILNDEAERMGISVNAMMNSVLKEYIEFTRFQSKLDMVIINREIFRSILKNVNEEEALKLGSELGEEIPHDTILFWKKHLTKDSVVEYIEKILCTYGRIGTYDEITEGEMKIIVIRHRLGLVGSKFLLGFLKSLLKTTLKIDCDLQITDYSLKILIT